MGKQSRKRRSTNKKSRVNADKNGGNDECPTSSSSFAVILRRVRHGDPRVRYGALSALVSTLFAPGAGADSSRIKIDTNKNSNNAITDDLLRGIAERITSDRDVSCASAAAGCILNYVTSSDENCDRLLRSVKNLDIVSVLWNRIGRSLVVVAGVDSFSSTVPSVESGNKKNDNKKKKTKTKTKMKKGKENAGCQVDRDGRILSTPFLQEEWSVASPCISAFCSLLESPSGSSCVERLTSTRGNAGGGEQSNSELTIILRIVVTSHALIARRGVETAGGGGCGGSTPVQALAGSERKVECHARVEEALFDSLISSVRILHSATENNPILSLTLTKDGVGGKTGMELILDVMTDSMCPAKARIHAAGCMVTMRHVLVAASAASPSKTLNTSSAKENDASVALAVASLEKIVTETVLPVLSGYIDYCPHVASAMAHRIANASELLRQDLRDDEFERGVEKMVQDRKEPARLIARRLTADKKGHATQEASGKDDGASAGDDTPMMETEEEEDGEDGDAKMVEEGDNFQGKKASSSARSAGEKKKKREDCDGGSKGKDNCDALVVLERAVDSWRGAFLPIKLALEVSANLSAGSINASFAANALADGNDDWTSDDEDRMEHFAQSMEDVAMQEGDEDREGERARAKDASFFDSLIKSDLPEKTLHLLYVLCSSPLSPFSTQSDHSSKNAADTNGENIAADIFPPAIVLDDVAELRSKCGACVGNLASNVPNWRSDKHATLDLWRQLTTSAEALLLQRSSAGSKKGADGDDGRRIEHDADDDIDGLSGITGAIAAVLGVRTRRTLLLPEIGESDLSLMLRLVDYGEHKADGSANANTSDTAVAPPSRCPPPEDSRRDAVSMLGTLCAEPHSSEVNWAVCSKLLQSLGNESSLSVVGAVWNALMDIYGGDGSGEEQRNTVPHRDVFVKLNVMDVMRRELPVFRERVSRQAAAADVSAEVMGSGRGLFLEKEGEEVLLARETALNASRFIKYMEMHLKKK